MHSNMFRWQPMTNQANTVRIVAGDLRSRKISFPANAAIRPTGGRIRETLFNWLQSRTHNSVCLDLFAGSGALGIEALSRGADEVMFIEKESSIASALSSNLELLNVTNGHVIHDDALSWIKTHNSAKTFDIVFLDPPFASSLLVESCELLERSDMLSSQCRIYIEAGQSISEIKLPTNWNLVKGKQAGHIYYYLISREV